MGGTRSSGSSPLPVRSSSFVHHKSLLHHSASSYPERRREGSRESQGLDRTSAYGSLLILVWFLEIAALPTEELAISQILQLEQHPPQVAEDIILRLASSHLEKGQLWYQAERQASFPDKVGQPLTASRWANLQDQVLGQLSGKAEPHFPSPCLHCLPIAPQRNENHPCALRPSAISADPYRTTTYIVCIKNHLS